MSEARSSHRVATPAPSWRRTVADALALAQSAVELDATNMDPSGALVAYTESVRRLRSIRARLERHGAHTDARQLATIVRVTASYLCYVCADRTPSAMGIPSGCASCPWRARCHPLHMSTSLPSHRSAAIVRLR
jgi:hypothetical protein